MKIIPPSGDVTEARETVVQAIYTTIMDTAEAASNGHMPDRGKGGLTWGGIENVVDSLIHLVQLCAAENKCPQCGAYQDLADRKCVRIETVHKAHFPPE